MADLQSPDPVERVFANADAEFERGTPEWLAHVFKWACATIPDDGSFEQFHKLAGELVRIYVRRSTAMSFIALVQTMRKSQREYFRTKAGAWLERAKSEEKAVDDWIALATKPPEKQRALFNTDPPREPYR